jgi:hypothetical protein
MVLEGAGTTVEEGKVGDEEGTEAKRGDELEKNGGGEGGTGAEE